MNYKYQGEDMVRHFQVLTLIMYVVFLSSCKELIGENFYEIDKNTYYRSAQLDPEVLDEKIKKYGIKTVINLRGENQGKPWYDEQVQVIKNNQIVQVDIRMGASRLPHKKDLITLLNTLDRSEKPILVHCQGGADRTGEASAIYQMIYMGKNKTQALKMLEVKYFHLKNFKPAKRYFISKIWQGERWAHEDYDPCHKNYKYYENQRACRGQTWVMRP